MDDEALLNLLSRNPALRSRIENILNVASNLDDSIELADSAEEKLVEPIIYGMTIGKKLLKID